MANIPNPQTLFGFLERNRSKFSFSFLPKPYIPKGLQRALSRFTYVIYHCKTRRRWSQREKSRNIVMLLATGRR